MATALWHEPQARVAGPVMSAGTSPMRRPQVSLLSEADRIPGSDSASVAISYVPGLWQDSQLVMPWVGYGNAMWWSYSIFSTGAARLVSPTSNAWPEWMAWT